MHLLIEFSPPTSLDDFLCKFTWILGMIGVFVISHVDNTHIECSALYHGQEGDRQIFNIESL